MWDLPRMSSSLLVVAIVSCAIGCGSSATHEARIDGIKRIPIPRREHGYKNFNSIVIATDAELKRFLAQVSAQEHWNNKKEFVAAIEGGSPNFRDASLVLIRDTVGSGSIKVSLDGPYADGRDVLYRINYELPGAGTTDMVYRCFAVSIPKGAARRMRVVRQGKNWEGLEGTILPLP